MLLAWALALIVAAGALALLTALYGSSSGSVYAIAALAVLAVLVERESIRLTPASEASVASLVFIFAGVVFGPLAGLIVGAAGLLSDFRRPYLRWAIWTSSRTLVAGAAAWTAYFFGGSEARNLGLLILAVGAASVVEAVADLVLGSVTLAIRGTGSLRTLGQDVAPLVIASVPLHTPVIAVLAYAYVVVSPWSAALFVLPAFAAQRLYVMYRQQRETSQELAIVNDRLEQANLSFATALVATLDARDRYTAGHSAAVAIYSRDIAARMGLSDVQQRLVHVAGLVHDIGKVGLPAGLLEKPGALTLEERRQMEQHSAIGERILANVEDYTEIAGIVRHHHERVDGNGYPDGLHAREIPLLSRIISVADAYNAMTSDRPYREAMPSRVARLRLAQAVETQFDTSVVAAFEAILAAATEAYRLAQSDAFALQTQERVATEHLFIAVAV